MSLRPGKKAAVVADGDGGAVAATPSPTVEDPLAEQAGPLPAKEDRIYVDNASLQDLKTTCDDAVERILTRPSGQLAPAPPASAAATSPSTSTTDLSTTAAASSTLHNDPSEPPPQFPPFKASHVHTDLRLVLGFLASFIIIGVCAWAYFIEKDWQKSKWWTGFGVSSYALLSALQALDAYIQGDRIFIGKRKMLSKRIETEILTISSPPLPKPTVERTVDGQRWIIPPTYTLQVEYARRSNGGKSLLRRVKESVVLGNLGEWFTEEGEFIEAIFEKRLISSLEKSWALEDE